MLSTDIINRLSENRDLSDDEFLQLLNTNQFDEELCLRADSIRRKNYGSDVYIRGLIEFTNYCKNNCYYCGIRCDNRRVIRYRMSPEEILETCKKGFELGFRTFVLQGGDDPYFTDDRICEIVSKIRKKYPQCAITLSFGERSRESYQAYFDAGANRYLLRHETASAKHYQKLHPDNMKLENRKQCLFDLKEIGFQVGAGFMVGSPFQGPEDIVEDIRFLQKLEPDMIGIGPFISHTDTPFKEYKNGSLELTLKLLSIMRMLFPYVLLPATTALGTIHEEGRELGLKAGANVLMPNISPLDVKSKYILYDNKICVKEDVESTLDSIKAKVREAGYQIVNAVGDVKRST